MQGVYYRASAKAKAGELHITGFAQNKPDGSVYIEAEGNQDQLDALIAWCKTGPARAVVTEVVTTPGEWKGFTTFDIRR